MNADADPGRLACGGVKGGKNSGGEINELGGGEEGGGEGGAWKGREGPQEGRGKGAVPI